MSFVNKKRPSLPIGVCADQCRGREGRYDEQGQGGPCPQGSSSGLARFLESCRARVGLASLRGSGQPFQRSPGSVVGQVRRVGLDGHGLVYTITRTFARLGLKIFIFINNYSFN